jgi:sugar phosphate isomerase/epimerase
VSRFRYAYNALVYYGEDIAQSVERVARYGYDAIELPGEPAAFETARIRAAVADAGIGVSSICSIYTDERDLAHPEPAKRAEALEYVREVADFASAVGAPTMIIAPTACMKTAPLAEQGDEWKWAVEGIRAGGEYAASVGVNLTLECWNRYETYFLNRLEQAARMWKETGLENGGVMGDTFHMNIEEGSIADAITQTGSLLNHVHIADSNRAAPGKGHIDFEPILQALADVNYDGYLSFELLPPSADPFGVMRAGGHTAFLDEYTESAINELKAVESRLVGAPG